MRTISPTQGPACFSNFGGMYRAEGRGRGPLLPLYWFLRYLIFILHAVPAVFLNEVLAFVVGLAVVENEFLIFETYAGSGGDG